MNDQTTRETSIRAMGPRILVRENNHASRKIGALYVQRLEKDRLCSGEVLSVSKHPQIAALGVEVGDTVWFKRECGAQAGDDDTLLFLLADMLEAVGEAEVQSFTLRVGR
jgi:co-chaperonin GroES (HSP10)